MKTLTKKIVRSNTFRIPGQNPRKEVIPPSRIKHWAKTGNQMLKSGIKIPAPLGHKNKQGEFVMPFIEGDSGITDPEKNQGFWKKFATKEEVDPETKQTHTVLYGELEVPDNLADKVGQTIQETSIYVRPTFVDGLDREWKDAPMHVALVTHAVEPGQENFVEGALALSMSMEEEPDPSQPTKKGKADSTGTNAKDSSDPEEQGDPSETSENLSLSIGELLSQLKEVAKIDLPEDTNPKNIIERLLGALRQKKLSEDEEEDEEGSVRQPPKKSKEPPKSVLMSQPVNLTPAQIDELVMAHPAYKASLDMSKNLLAHATDTARRSLTQRVARLIKAGRCTKEFADENLMPSVAAHQISFNDKGEPNASPIELTLKALEAMVVPTQSEQADPAVAMSHFPGIPPFLFRGSKEEAQRMLAMSMGANVNDFEFPQAPGPNGRPELTAAQQEALADQMAAMA